MFDVFEKDPFINHEAPHLGRMTALFEDFIPNALEQLDSMILAPSPAPANLFENASIPPSAEVQAYAREMNAPLASLTPKTFPESTEVHEYSQKMNTAAPLSVPREESVPLTYEQDVTQDQLRMEQEARAYLESIQGPA